ncbi:hypothetical protein Tco_0741077, partial [Tanacetum coccineum]
TESNEGLDANSIENEDDWYQVIVPSDDYDTADKWFDVYSRTNAIHTYNGDSSNMLELGNTEGGHSSQLAIPQHSRTELEIINGLPINMVKLQEKMNNIHSTLETCMNTQHDSGMFLSSSKDKTGILDQIEKKIERAFNVLRYDLGQKYNSHYDALNPTEYGPQKSQQGGWSGGLVGWSGVDVSFLLYGQGSFNGEGL